VFFPQRWRLEGIGNGPALVPAQSGARALK
jgi:hypothetical protein